MGLQSKLERAGWDQLPANEQKKVYVEFTRNLYSILAELRAEEGRGISPEDCSTLESFATCAVIFKQDRALAFSFSPPLMRSATRTGSFLRSPREDQVNDASVHFVPTGSSP